MSVNEKKLFAAIEKQYNWKLKEVTILTGGLMHKMYHLKTNQGDYALKVLNQFVMQRKSAMDNYRRAEKLECLLEKNNIPILPALSFNGKKMQEINGVYFYLFDYYPGRALKHNEIKEVHCLQIGKVLAKIHNIDKLKTIKFSQINIDWDFYLTRLKQADQLLYKLLKDNYSLIIESQNNSNLAKSKLPKMATICHNDMDCKNVLWNNQDYRIIDLECLNYNHPFIELFELALCYSGYEKCQIDFNLFNTFIKGYVLAGGKLPTDWNVLYDCNNRLEWLEYNLKRVLGIDCGKDEKEIGVKQSIKTIKLIIYYDKMQKEILENCHKF